MKEILYLMHISWDWIKQRPHFIAQELGQEFNVTVSFKYDYQNNNLTYNKIPNFINIKKLKRLPFERFKIILLLNNIYYTYQLKINFQSYDIIWVTSPEIFKHIKTFDFSNKILIYDCMDDLLEFEYVKSDISYKKFIFNIENELVLKSNIIFTSSEYLKNKLNYRYNRSDINLINNALTLNPQQPENDIFSSKFNIFFNEKKIKLSYIGTISEWFDFDLILDSLEKFENIVYYLFGPVQCDIPKHERIYYFGSVEHDYIFKIMEFSDALIMPFKINELVLSVDPVKIYEYIYSGKPCISINYSETQKFNNYIYLYKDKAEYFKLISNLINKRLFPKKSKSECEDFISNNNWKNRTKKIIEIINNYKK